MHTIFASLDFGSRLEDEGGTEHTPNCSSSANIAKLKMKTHVHRLINSAQIGRIRSNLAAEISKVASPCECGPCKRLNYRAEFCPACGKHWPAASDPSYTGAMQANRNARSPRRRPKSSRRTSCTMYISQYNVPKASSKSSKG